jgi:hypothetical protein
VVHKYKERDMAIKVYRVKIEGFVVKRDSELTPADWGPQTVVQAMESVDVTQTLLDTIEDEAEQPVSMEPLEIALDILQSIDGNDQVDTAQEYICRYHNEVSARASGTQLPEGEV